MKRAITALTAFITLEWIGSFGILKVQAAEEILIQEDTISILTENMGHLMPCFLYALLAVYGAGICLISNFLASIPLKKANERNNVNFL